MSSNVSPLSAEALSHFQVSGFMGQLSASYNLFSISIAVDVMGDAGIDFTTWASDLQYTAIYGGSILGMMLMGYVGDRVGRSWAMSVTLALTVFGALGSGFAIYGSETDMFLLISFFRFILGWGIGGTFPLSSTQAGDKTAGKGMLIRRLAMAWSYFGQGPGNILPYLFVLALDMIGTGYVAMWRGVLAFGAVPALYVFCTQGIKPKADQPVFKNRQLTNRTDLKNEVWSRLCSKEYIHKLLGAGGSWFLYDFVTNSVKTLAPVILEDYFGNGDDEPLTTMCWQNMMLNSLSIPALLATMYALAHFGPRQLIMISALVQTLLFFGLGISRLVSPHNSNMLLAFLILLYFFQQFGVGSCNYIVAAEMFPIEVRSTFSGLSAGCGKLGAIYGIVCMNQLLDMFGTGATMIVMGFVSIALYAVTAIFVESKSEMENDLAYGANKPLIAKSPAAAAAEEPI